MTTFLLICLSYFLGVVTSYAIYMWAAKKYVKELISEFMRDTKVSGYTGMRIFP